MPDYLKRLQASGSGRPAFTTRSGRQVRLTGYSATNGIVSLTLRLASR